MHATGKRGETWKQFLVMNPHLANGGLFLHYYSKNLMLMTASSRTEIVLPDKIPLPSLISDVTRMMPQQPGISEMVVRDELPVEAFLASVRHGAMSNWGHEAYLRVVFELLLLLGRRQGKDVIFEHLGAVEKANFHLTLAYFWIQMVQLHLLRLGVDVANPTPLEKRPRLSDLKDVHDSFLYREYYSEEALFGPSSKAATEFVLPDKKQFPVN